jgi:hypothetical protein
VCILTVPALAETGRSIVIVLDASGSMNTKLPDGQIRMEAAKAAVADLAGKLGDDTRVALRVYGHQSSPQQKNCRDSALVVGFGPAAANRARIVDQAHGVKAQGYTPISYSLQLAAKDLTGETATERVVLLVSDGKETCEGDPCAAAKALADADAKLVVHTVGVDVDAETRSQLQCIARQARGRYFDAASATELSRVLATAAVTVAQELPVSTTTISTKAASRDEKAPVPITAGEVVKGRLAGGGAAYHYWKVAAPAGKYRVVLDTKMANDESSNIFSEVIAFRADGGQLAKVLSVIGIDFRTRAAGEIDATANPDMVLRVGNGASGIVDYWLGLFPVDAKVPSPYFVRAPKIEPLVFGQPFSATLDPKPGEPAEVWYSAKLKGQDYRISAEYVRLDGKSSNVAAKVEILGPIGERLKGMQDRVCSVIKIDTSARCVTKLVLADDIQVLFRLTPSNDVAYRTTFTVEPLN